MRISVKLAVYSVVLTAIAVILCCAALLITAADSQINTATKSGISELHMLDNAFLAEMDVVGDSTLSDEAQRSLILFVFRKYTDASVNGSHYVLTDTQKTMFNDSPIDPGPLLPGLEENARLAMKDRPLPDNDAALWPSVIAELDGRRYLVVGHWDINMGEKMGSFAHEIFLVRDITEVYNGITVLGIRFAVIALITVALSAAILIFVIRRIMHPLGDLQKNAAALANGEYGNRILVQGRNEISELGTSFNRMAGAVSSHIKALENTAEQRKLLLSALTHELKTPMTAIIGYSEALMRMRLKKAQQDESIAYINSECRRIERLSQKMMQLITLQDGETADIKSQTAANLFEAVDMTLQGIARKENLNLTLTEKDSPVFEMDTDMMASVLINLFDNARRASAKHITIAAEGNSITVQDDGAGIPPDEIEKIKLPFYMVDKSHSRSEGGSGLGLALCEMIIKAHGASLTIKSELGKGTSVSIFFKKITF